MARKLTEEEKMEIYSYAREITEKGRVSLLTAPISIRHHFKMAGWEDIAIKVAVALIMELLKQWLSGKTRIGMAMPQDLWKDVEVS